MEIRDKSKGDTLSKGLVIVQTSLRFLLQCIARGISHLPITGLELVTVAFVTITFVTNGLWWYKPLYGECGVRVYRKHQDGRVKEGIEGQASVGTGGPGSADRIPSEIDERSNLVDESAIAIPEAPAAAERNINPWVIATKRMRGFILDPQRGPMWVVVLVVVLAPIWIPLYALVQMLVLIGELMGFGDTEHEIEAGAKGVPTLYSGNRRNRILAINVGMVTATIFGGIHCVASSFQFPSYNEKAIWVVISAGAAGSPAFWVAIVMIASYFESSQEASQETMKILSGVAIACVIFRVMLLVLTFIALRSLPLDVYKTVQWTSFIPHM